jgi:hypothetical protein
MDDAVSTLGYLMNALTVHMTSCIDVLAVFGSVHFGGCRVTTGWWGFCCLTGRRNSSSYGFNWFWVDRSVYLLSKDPARIPRSEVDLEISSVVSHEIWSKVTSMSLHACTRRETYYSDYWISPWWQSTIIDDNDWRRMFSGHPFVTIQCRSVSLRANHKIGHQDFKQRFFDWRVYNT